jgi:hypothetical protein
VLDGVTVGSGDKVDGGVFDGVFGGEFGGVGAGVPVLVGVGNGELVFDGEFGGVGAGVPVLVGVGNGELVFDGEFGGVGAGVPVLVGVGNGELVGVVVGSDEQSNTVFTFPNESNVTTYVNDPSIISEYPPGLDEYVLIVNNVLL